MILYAILSPVIISRRVILHKIESYQNEILNNFSDLVLNDPIIKANKFEGIFLVDKRSDLFKQMIRNKSYEPILVEQGLKYIDTDRDIIDVGANIGFFTVLFAKKSETIKKFWQLSQQKMQSSGLMKTLILIMYGKM